MGGRKPTVSDREILGIFAETTEPVLSASEVADQLPIGQTGTYQRLRELHDRGLLDTKKVGQGRAWWITDEGRTFVDEESD
ncbi:helix-turn-helix domain-containing protein [Haloarchaeobius iranensis]|uniref:IclR helix-turn-helix domain-containing protein n=1 Tax=Haloarchaeobius iranensis TaxID=996166 RepID=A0A1G9XGG8_9EURY|nr:helix-turn-helix domain-containing protein [Haloarchaeobius iranensis]SDM95787.1 IclR helix-turn-helix domain-containing protein [Haloarchaeobius iranensis]